MYRVTLDLPGAPHPGVLAAFLEAVALSNALWFLREWSDGRDPPCCCRCADVLYAPEALDVGTWCVGLPMAFDLPTASCHTAAAVTVGHKRAKDVRGGLSMAAARARHSVELHPTEKHYWHAWYRGPDGLEDVTREMDPA